MSEIRVNVPPRHLDHGWLHVPTLLAFVATRVCRKRHVQRLSLDYNTVSQAYVFRYVMYVYNYIQI